MASPGALLQVDTTPHSSPVGALEYSIEVGTELVVCITTTNGRTKPVFIPIYDDVGSSHHPYHAGLATCWLFFSAVKIAKPCFT